MNEVPAKIQLKSEEDMKSVAAFLSNSFDTTVIPCDDPLEGLNGFVALRGEGSDEKSLFFCYPYGNPAVKTEKFGFNSDVTEAEVAMTRCLSESGWVKADDPKRLMIGFVKHEPVGAVASSRAVLFSLRAVKRMSTETRDKLTAWRETS